MNAPEINLVDLRERFEQPPRVTDTVGTQGRRSARRLGTLLRVDGGAPAYGDVREQRPLSDEALTYYSLMEVACIAGYIPSRFPVDYVERALSVLDSLSVQHSGLLLPQAHVERLHGRWTRTDSGADLVPLFVAFTSVSRVTDDPDVKSFRSLVANEPRGASIKQLLAIIGDPRTFARALLKGSPRAMKTSKGVWRVISDPKALSNPKRLLARLQPSSAKLNETERSLHGFRKFLLFCGDLYRLLEAARNYPLTQSAMWHYHAWWFAGMGNDLRGYLESAVELFVAWQVGLSDPDIAERRSRAAGELRLAVERLCSAKYALGLAGAQVVERRERLRMNAAEVMVVPGRLTAALIARDLGRSLSKSEIAVQLAKSMRQTKRVARRFLDDLTALAYREARNSFTIPGIGKLVLVNRKVRMGRNPATGEEIKIPARRVVRFRVSKRAKDAILGAKK